jgi:hypothetical protein
MKYSKEVFLTALDIMGDSEECNYKLKFFHALIIAVKIHKNLILLQKMGHYREMDLTCKDDLTCKYDISIK